MNTTTASHLVVGCVASLALTAGTSQPDISHTPEPTHDRPPPSDCLTATNDPAVTERRPLAAFTALEVTVPVNIVYTTADTAEIVLTAPREVLDEVTTDIASGTLRIATTTACWRLVDVTLNARIAAPPVAQVHLTATASLAIANAWIVERFDITLDEASTFDARINADTINISATGTSRVGLTGTAPRVDIQLDDASRLDAEVDTDALTLHATGTSDAAISGTTAELNATLDEASNLDAAELTTAIATIVATDTSQTTINVSDTLTVDLDEASTVSYHGSPSITLRSIDETSQLIPLDD